MRHALGYRTYKGKRVSVLGSGMGNAEYRRFILYELLKFYNVDAIIRVGSTGSYSERLPMKSCSFLVKGSYSESTMP